METLERTDRRSTPPLGRVLREQFHCVSLSLRWPAAAAIALMALTTLLISGGLLGADEPIDFHPELSMLPGMVGLLLPIGVWMREDRFGSAFLWTLPVDRRSHALIKVGAGWVWLMGACALFSLWLLTMTLLTGGGVLVEQTIHVLPSGAMGPAEGVDAATLRSVRVMPQPLFWIVPLTGATGAYLLGSAFKLGARRPLWWVVGTALAAFFVVTAADITKAHWVVDAINAVIRPLYFGPYGFDALLTARAESLKTLATLSTGETVSVWRGVPDLGQWLVATLVWTTAGLIALWFAASRHRENRRA